MGRPAKKKSGKSGVGEGLESWCLPVSPHVMIGPITIVLTDKVTLFFNFFKMPGAIEFGWWWK